MEFSCVGAACLRGSSSFPQAHGAFEINLYGGVFHDTNEDQPDSASPAAIFFVVAALLILTLAFSAKASAAEIADRSGSHYTAERDEIITFGVGFTSTTTSFKIVIPEAMGDVTIDANGATLTNVYIESNAGVSDSLTLKNLTLTAPDGNNDGLSFNNETNTKTLKIAGAVSLTGSSETGTSNGGHGISSSGALKILDAGSGALTVTGGKADGDAIAGNGIVAGGALTISVPTTTTGGNVTEHGHRGGDGIYAHGGAVTISASTTAQGGTEQGGTGIDKNGSGIYASGNITLDTADVTLVSKGGGTTGADFAFADPASQHILVEAMGVTIEGSGNETKNVYIENNVTGDVTLTLKNLSLKAPGGSSNHGLFFSYSFGTKTLRIAGAVSLTGNTGNNSAGGSGIESRSALVILDEGQGALVATGSSRTDAGTGGNGISAGGALTISVPTTATGGNSQEIFGGDGIFAQGTLKISVPIVATGGDSSGSTFSNKRYGLAIVATGGVTLTDAGATLTLTEGKNAKDETTNRAISLTRTGFSDPWKVTPAAALTSGTTADDTITVTSTTHTGASPYPSVVIAFRTPIAADAANNAITVGANQTAGVSFTVTAAGDNQNPADTMLGDTRYIPVSVSDGTNSVNFTEQGGVYTASMTMASAGSYTLTATFRKEAWATGVWSDASADDTKTASVTVTVQQQQVGGGGSVVVTPPITVAKPENGTIKTVPTNPKTGDTVTVTVTPNDGYELDKLTVTDKNGKELTVTKHEDGTYRFTYGGSPVTIAAVFVPAPESWENPFADVKKGEWFCGDVQYVVENGLFLGTSETTFSPNIAMSRAMLVTVLYRMAGELNVKGQDNPFSDVEAGQWYTDAVIWAASNGITAGYGDGTFGTGDEITREDLCVMLMRFMELMGIELPVEREATDFADTGEVSGYAKDAVMALYRARIIEGKGGGIFDPQGEATRAELAAMLHRFLEATGFKAK